MATSFFETAVKLAALGAAGVCVFGLLCCVWLLSRSESADKPQLQSLIKWFMGLCVLTAAVTALSSLLGARTQAAKVPGMQAEIDRLTKDNADQITRLQKQERNLDRYRQRQREYATNYNDGIGTVKTLCQLPLVPSRYSEPVLKWLETIKPRTVEEED